MADNPDPFEDKNMPEEEQLVPPLRKADDPMSLPDDLPYSGKLNNTHPATDTNIDSDEAYNEGLSEAAEAYDTDPKDAIGDYNPRHDKHPDKDS